MEAANGAGALKILGANPGIQCLFTDIVMPNMTGR
jgi:YesN/AraC family two-component response regulator